MMVALKVLGLVSVSLGLLLGGFGCSTASVRVMPGEDGNHTVVSRDIEQAGAEEEAVKAAEKYCNRAGQTAVFVSDSSKYEGKMDEGTRKAVRGASTGAMILGGSGVLGNAGMMGASMTSDRDYKSEVKFKCK